MRKLALLFLLLAIPINIKAISTSAQSAILMDIDSKRILYAENIHDQRSVASISKVMTALIAIESGKLNDKVTVGDEIEDSYGSGIYIKQGEVLTLNDLLYGLMLRSGNDASYSIAKYVGGSVENFVKLMNDKSEQLGLKNTIFNNPNGLDDDEGNYSTAYDMALITSYAYQYEDFKKIIATKKYTLKTNMNTYIWYNKNKLINTYKYATGGKTGYTLKARRTLVNTASKDDLNLVVVTLNDGNDFQDHQNLFEYGFNNYTSYQILKKGNINILNEEYYKNYKFYIKNGFKYPLTEEEKDLIILKFNLEKIRQLENDVKVGNVEVYLGDDIIHTEDIYITKQQEEKSFFQKLKEWIKNL